MKGPLVRRAFLVFTLLLLAVLPSFATAAGINGAQRSRAVSLKLGDLPKGYTVAKTGLFPNSKAGQDPTMGGIPGMLKHGRLGAYIAVFSGSSSLGTVQSYVTMYNGVAGGAWAYAAIVRQGLQGTRSAAPGVGTQSAAFRYSQAGSSHFTTVVFQRGWYVGEVEVIGTNAAPSVQQVIGLARIEDQRMIGRG